MSENPLNPADLRQDHAILHFFGLLAGVEEIEAMAALLVSGLGAFLRVDAAVLGFQPAGTDTVRVHAWERGTSTESLARIAGPASIASSVSGAMEKLGYAEPKLLSVVYLGRTLGYLAVARREARELTPEQEFLLTSFQSLTALLLANREHSQQLQTTSELQRRTADQLRLALEAAALGYWDYRFTTGEVFWDARCRDGFGLASGVQIDYPEAISRIHPDDRSGTDQAVSRAIGGADEGRYDQEFRVVWPDGSVHWIASHGRVYFEGDGEQRHAVRFIGVNSEITERKRWEEQLRQSQEWLRVTLTSIGDAVIATDTEGRITFLNPVAAALTGWQPEEAQGQPVQHVFRIANEHTWAPAEDIVARVLQEGRTLELANHTALLTKAGHKIPIEDSAAPIRDSAGNISGVVLVFHDVTEKRRKAEELHSLNRTLRALSNSNQALLHATDEAAFLRQVCRIITEDCGHAMVWVGLAEDDEEKTIRPVACAGFEQGYIETLRLTWADNERGRGPTGTAIRTGQACSCQNTLSDPSFEPWRAEALKRGYASSLVLPLLQQGKAFGAISIYSGKPGAFFPHEVKLLSELAADVVYGITMLRLRVAHAQAAEALRERTSLLEAANVQLRAEIIERTAAEEALRQAKQQWERTFNSVPDLIAILDNQRRIVRVNHAMAQRLGAAPEACADLRCFDCVHGTAAPHELCPHTLTLQDQKEHVVEVHEERLGGDFLVSTTPLFDAEGKMEGVVHVARDITERKRAQEALLRSEKLASVGRMALTVAHEINNPLAAVMNTLYLAQASADDPASVRQYLGMADDELKRIAHLTRQTLGFYRESSAPAPVSVNAILDSALELLQGKIKLKGAAISKRYAGDLQATAVYGELRQVFSNLLANSLDAIDAQGTIKLRVSKSNCARDGGCRIRVTVADNGKGIDPATLPRIFEPLFTTKPMTGSGLGLWVSKQLIDKHQGAIRVRSNTAGEHRGTTFSVLIPAVAEQGCQARAAGAT